jgi:hypothetical protein
MPAANPPIDLLQRGHRDLKLRGKARPKAGPEKFWINLAFFSMLAKRQSEGLQEREKSFALSQTWT